MARNVAGVSDTLVETSLSVYYSSHSSRTLSIHQIINSSVYFPLKEIRDIYL